MARSKETFEEKWGINLYDFAVEEGVSDVAIRMRIFVHGSPFQRTRRPSMFEHKWGMTLTDVAKLLGISVYTVRNRVGKYGTPFLNLQRQKKTSTFRLRPGEKLNKGWLHPLHPSYDKWQAKCAAKREAIEYVDV